MTPDIFLLSCSTHTHITNISLMPVKQEKKYTYMFEVVRTDEAALRQRNVFKKVASLQALEVLSRSPRRVKQMQNKTGRGRGN